MHKKTGYFLDTSAIIEIVKGNKKFEEYIERELFTSLFNLYELYFILLRDFNEPIAKEFFYQFKKRTIPIQDKHIFAAALFRKENKTKGFSYTDCLGYAISLDIGIKFLAKDNAFEGFENVELVK